MSLVRPILFVAFCGISFNATSLFAMDGQFIMDEDITQNEPLTQFVFQNFEKDLRLQFTFQFRNSRPDGAKTNFIKLAPSERKTFNLSEMVLWDSKDTCEHRQVKISEVDLQEIEVLASWPSTGEKFYNDPPQPFGPRSGPRQPPKILVEFVGLVNNNSKSLDAKFDLDHGTFIRIIQNPQSGSLAQDSNVEFQQSKVE